MSHLHIPIISSLDQHYTPRHSTDSRRPSVESAAHNNHTATSSHSHLHLPLISSLDEHYSPRASISDEHRPSRTAPKTTQHHSKSQLHLPLISSLDAYYSGRPSVEEHHRPSVSTVSHKGAPATASVSQTKKQHKPTFMDSIQRYPWFSGSH